MNTFETVLKYKLEFKKAEADAAKFEKKLEELEKTRTTKLKIETSTADLKAQQAALKGLRQDLQKFAGQRNKIANENAAAIRSEIAKQKEKVEATKAEIATLRTAKAENKISQAREEVRLAKQKAEHAKTQTAEAEKQAKLRPPRSWIAEMNRVGVNKAFKTPYTKPLMGEKIWKGNASNVLPYTPGHIGTNVIVGTLPGNMSKGSTVPMPAQQLLHAIKNPTPPPVIKNAKKLTEKYYADQDRKRQQTSRLQWRSDMAAMTKLPVFGSILGKMARFMDKALVAGGTTNKADRADILHSVFGDIAGLAQGVSKAFLSLGQSLIPLLTNPYVAATALAGLATAGAFVGSSLINAADMIMKKYGHFGQAAWNMIGLNLVRPFLEAAGELQQMHSGYVNSAGGTEAGFQRMSDIAKLPGLTYQGTVQAGTRLVASGMPEDQALLLLSRLGNAVAKLPNSVEALNDAMYGLSQIQSMDKISQLEVRQVIQPIPELGRLMKAAFGTQRAEDISAMGFTGPEFVKIITDLLGTTKPTEAGAKTSLENWDDAMYKLNASFGAFLSKDVAPFIDRITESLNNLVSSGALEGLADAVVQFFNLNDSTAMIKTIQELPDTIKGILDGFNNARSVLSHFWEALVTWAQNIEEITTWIFNLSNPYSWVLHKLRGSDDHRTIKGPADKLIATATIDGIPASEYKNRKTTGPTASIMDSLLKPGEKPKTMEDIKKDIAGHKKVGEDQLKMLEDIEKNTRIDFESFSKGGNDALRRGFSVVELEGIRSKPIKVHADAGQWSVVVEGILYQALEQLTREGRLAIP